MTPKFKTIKRYSVEAPGDEVELSDDLLTNYTEFDPAGNVIKEITYGQGGDIEQLIEYLYDDKNNILEESHYNEENERTEHHTYERNPDASIDTELISYMDGSVDTVTYKYDSQGLLIEKIQIDDEEEEETREVREYHDGMMTSLMIYENGELLTKDQNVYNSDNQVVEKTEWNADDDIEIKFVYDFEGGHNIKASKSVDGKLTEISDYTHDEQGRVSDIIEEDAYSRTRVRLAYDEKGNVLEQKEESEAGELISIISRSFDEGDNMLTSDVYIAPQADFPGRKYRVIYKYEFAD